MGVWHVLKHRRWFFVFHNVEISRRLWATKKEDKTIRRRKAMPAERLAVIGKATRHLTHRTEKWRIKIYLLGALERIVVGFRIYAYCCQYRRSPGLDYTNKGCIDKQYTFYLQNFKNNLSIFFVYSHAVFRENPTCNFIVFVYLLNCRPMILSTVVTCKIFAQILDSKIQNLKLVGKWSRKCTAKFVQIHW